MAFVPALIGARASHPCQLVPCRRSLFAVLTEGGKCACMEVWNSILYICAHLSAAVNTVAIT